MSDPDTTLEGLLAHSVHRSVDTGPLLAHLERRRRAIEGAIVAGLEQSPDDLDGVRKVVWSTLYEVDPDVHRLVIQGAGGTTDSGHPALTASADMQPLAP